MSKYDISISKFRGKIGEFLARQDYQNHGFQVIPIWKGADFIAQKKIGKEIIKEYVEVKIGKSRLSKTQQKQMRKAKNEGTPYTVYRISTKFLEHYLFMQRRTVN